MGQVIDFNERRQRADELPGIRLVPTERGRYQPKAPAETRIAGVRRLTDTLGWKLGTDKRGHLEVTTPDWTPDGAA